MLTLERRRRRGESLVDALTFQLAAFAEGGGLTAMVLSDDHGGRLAAWGDARVCDDVLGRAPVPDADVEVVAFGGLALVLWAVGGGAAARRRALTEAAASVARILGRWIADGETTEAAPA